MSKIIQNIVKSQKFPSIYYEIDVVQKDGDDRIRTDSRCNSVDAHAQKENEQESPAVADKPARRLRKVCTVYVRAVGL